MNEPNPHSSYPYGQSAPGSMPGQGENWQGPPGGMPGPQWQMPIYSYTPPGNPNGQAIASLVLGIVSIVCLPTSYFGGAYIGAITGILGIVFAAVGMNKVNGRGLAIAGLVLSIIGTIISLCIVAILLSLFAAAIKASH